jgi:hypothetical protein
MTKIIYILLISVSIAACNQKASKTQKLDAGAIETDEGTNKEPVISFDKKIWDFGTITDGEVVEHTFRFTNTGTNDLIISNASASCGCTIPEWPKEPIAPGEKGEIKVEFNSNGKKDMVTKDITILANTNPVKTILQIKVFVEKKKS